MYPWRHPPRVETHGTVSRGKGHVRSRFAPYSRGQNKRVTQADRSLLLARAHLKPSSRSVLFLSERGGSQPLSLCLLRAAEPPACPGGPEDDPRWHSRGRPTKLSCVRSVGVVGHIGRWYFQEHTAVLWHSSFVVFFYGSYCSIRVKVNNLAHFRPMKLQRANIPQNEPQSPVPRRRPSANSQPCPRPWPIRSF